MIVKIKNILVFVVALLLVVCLGAVIQMQSLQSNINITTHNNSTPVKTDANLSTHSDSNQINGVHVVFYLENVPKTAKKGQSVKLVHVIVNKGMQTIYDVKVFGQNFDESLGVLRPGETKKRVETVIIPLKDVLSPYPVGGNALWYKDFKGKQYQENFPIYKIKLT